MGFEYKIKIQLTNEEKEKIKDIIPSKELRSFEDEMKFEDDGIYVVKYDRPDLWLRLEVLRDFIEKTKRKYEIEEL